VISDEVMRLVTAQEDQARALLVAGISTIQRLREQALLDDVTWVLPDDVLPGCAALYGIPVVHASVPGPMLSHWVRMER
jgi:hypothetical protein